MDNGDRSKGLDSFALPRLAARIFSTPLMIQPDKLEAILTVVGPRLQGGGTLQFQGADGRRVGPGRVRHTVDGIAVIPVLDTLVMSAGGVHPASGLTSYGQIEEAFDEAVADPMVRGILLEIDSPGGEVSGAFDLVDRILSARGAKPVWAIVNEMALSAGYAIASAAERVLLPRTALVGSVGVVAVHVDRSARDQGDGLAYSFMFAGEKKIDGNPHQPLSDRARADIQADIDAVMDVFVAAVARGRGMAEPAVRATEAGIFTGEAAVAAGLADGVRSFRETLVELSESARARRTLFVGSAGAETILPTALRNARGDQPIRTPEMESSAPVVEPGKPAGPRTSDQEKKMTDATKTETGAETEISTTAESAGAVKTAKNTADDDNVVDLDKVRADARAAAIADVSCIVDLCALAGLPALAKGFIDEELSGEEVRKRLLTARAEASDEADVTSRHEGGTHGDAANNYGWDRAFARAAGRHPS